MRIRKPVNELTPADIFQHPVWEYASDEEGMEEGQDETTVRPADIDLPIDPSDGPFQIRAVFTLADGTQMTGLVTVPAFDLSDLGYLQPVIVTDQGPVLFWLGSFESDSYPQTAYNLLQRTQETTFPIQVCADDGILTDDLAFSIPGFLVLEDWQTGKVKVLT